MKDDKEAAVGGGSPYVERELGRLAAAPVPTGLRRRILDRAEEAQRGAALTPGMRVLAIACSVMIVGAVAGDPLIGRHEAARLAAVLDGRPPAGQAERPVPELNEALTGDRGVNRLARLQALAESAARADRPTNLIEAREWLKGWLNNENLENPD